MSANMTMNEALIMREQAIARAVRERLPDKIMYLCLEDPGNVSDNSDVFTRPLAGGGVFLRYYASNSSDRVVAEESERPGKLRFEAIRFKSPEKTRWQLLRFRSGAWVDRLLAEYNKVTFRKDNADIVALIEKFGIMDEDSHA